MRRKRFLVVAAGALAFPVEALGRLMNVSITTSDPDGMGLSGTETVTVSAAPQTNLVRTELYIDDGLKAQVPTSALAYEWDTTLVANGTHRLRGDAVYKKRRSSAQIAVTVNNMLPTSGFGAIGYGVGAWGG